MKRPHFLALTTLAVWAVFGTVGYAGYRPVLAANIPFDFMVDTTRLAAGNYTISQVGNDVSVLHVRNEDSNEGVFVQTQKTIDRKATQPGPPRFEFIRYSNQDGDHHFLAKVWKGIDNTGREMPTDIFSVITIPTIVTASIR